MDPSFTDSSVFVFLSQYAYQAYLVYTFVFFMMLISAFGVPIPEEITILSVAWLAFMGTQPERWPPPYPGAVPINGYEAALVTFFAVFFSDHLVYFLGRKFGPKIFKHPRLQTVFSPQVMARIDRFTHKYGIYAAFLFRFVPGIRFPGHLALGMTKLTLWKFSIMDFMAAAIGVPLQILLIYHYGDPILKTLSEFKIVALGLLLTFLVIHFGKKWWQKRRAQTGA